MSVVIAHARARGGFGPLNLLQNLLIMTLRPPDVTRRMEIALGQAGPKLLDQLVDALKAAGQNYVIVQSRWCAVQGSNLRLLACEASALPLS